MAYWYDSNALKGKSSGRMVEYIADTDSDINDLPTSTTEGVPQEGDSTLHRCVEKGSTCLVINPSSLYKLNSKDEWVEM